MKISAIQNKQYGLKTHSSCKSITTPHFKAQKKAQSNQIDFIPHWVKNETIKEALQELHQLEFSKEDIKHVKRLGAKIPFESGKDAVNLINKKNVRIIFEQMESPSIHALYDYNTNFIMINKNYKNSKNPAIILAIAEAILHEAGHAKDGDSSNSLQEEINCLSLNAISHRALRRKYPNIFDATDSLIVKDGVCVYEKLFFDSDLKNQKLVKRLKDKYGHLPAGDLRHPPSILALRVKMNPKSLS